MSQFQKVLMCDFFFFFNCATVMMMMITMVMMIRQMNDHVWGRGLLRLKKLIYKLNDLSFFLPVLF